MPADKISGTAIAKVIRQELKVEVDEMRETLGVTPGLAVVLVGERRDSATYVRSKKKACTEIGIESYGFDFPDDVTQEELIAKVEELNADPKVVHSDTCMAPTYLSGYASLTLAPSPRPTP